MQRCLIRGVTFLALGVMPAIGTLAAMSTGSDEPAASARAVKGIDAHVRAIAQDAKGQMWFGTDGEGLVHFDGMKCTCNI